MSRNQIRRTNHVGGTPLIRFMVGAGYSNLLGSGFCATPCDEHS